MLPDRGLGYGKHEAQHQWCLDVGNVSDRGAGIVYELHADIQSGFFRSVDGANGKPQYTYFIRIGAIY